MVMSNQKFCFVQPRWCLSGIYNVSPFKGEKFFAEMRSGANLYGSWFKFEFFCQH